MGDILKIEKVCGFYISSMHLITMMLPYIKKQIDEKAKIETILEYNLVNTVENVLSKLVINKEEKDIILGLNWKENKTQKYSLIDNKLKKIFSESKKINILITGRRKYIEEANRIIDKFINKNSNKIKDKKVTIINCYEVNEFDDNIREILDTHHAIINTAGIHKIEEIFEDYKNIKIK